MTAPETLINFLHGAAPNADGLWFDDAAKREKGAFWWRKYLRQLERLHAAEVATLAAKCEAQESGSLFLMDLIRRHADALTAEDEALRARLLNLIREFRWAFPKAEPALRARYPAALSTREEGSE